MGWWQILKLIIQYGPSAVALIKEILDLIEEIKKDKPDTAAFLTRQLDVTAKRARAEKDKAPLQAMAAKLRGVVNGSKQPL